MLIDLKHLGFFALPIKWGFSLMEPEALEHKLRVTQSSDGSFAPLAFQPSGNANFSYHLQTFQMMQLMFCQQ